MKAMSFLLGALALTACEAKAPETPAADAPAATVMASLPACADPVRKEVPFTAPDSKDVFELAAVGENCREASVLATVRTPAGVLLWSHADIASQTLAFAGIEDTGETPARALNALMQAWLSNVEASTTADAPEWKEGDERPEGPTGLYYGTEYNRTDYTSIRAEGRRMLCHPIYLNRTQCVIYYDGNGAAPYATEYFDMRS